MANMQLRNKTTKDGVTWAILGDLDTSDEFLNWDNKHPIDFYIRLFSGKDDTNLNVNMSSLNDEKIASFSKTNWFHCLFHSLYFYDLDPMDNWYPEDVPATAANVIAKGSDGLEGNWIPFLSTIEGMAPDAFFGGTDPKFDGTYSYFKIISLTKTRSQKSFYVQGVLALSTSGTGDPEKIVSFNMGWDHGDLGKSKFNLSTVYSDPVGSGGEQDLIAAYTLASKANQDNACICVKNRTLNNSNYRLPLNQIPEDATNMRCVVFFYREEDATSNTTIRLKYYDSYGTAIGSQSSAESLPAEKGWNKVVFEDFLVPSGYTGGQYTLNLISGQQKEFGNIVAFVSWSKGTATPDLIDESNNLTTGKLFNATISRKNIRWNGNVLYFSGTSASSAYVIPGNSDKVRILLFVYRSTEGTMDSRVTMYLNPSEGSVIRYKSVTIPKAKGWHTILIDNIIPNNDASIMYAVDGLIDMGNGGAIFDNIVSMVSWSVPEEEFKNSYRNIGDLHIKTIDSFTTSSTASAFKSITQSADSATGGKVVTEDINNINGTIKYLLPAGTTSNLAIYAKTDASTYELLKTLPAQANNGSGYMEVCQDYSLDTSAVSIAKPYSLWIGGAPSTTSVEIKNIESIVSIYAKSVPVYDEDALWAGLRDTSVPFPSAMAVQVDRNAENPYLADPGGSIKGSMEFSGEGAEFKTLNQTNILLTTGESYYGMSAIQAALGGAGQIVPTGAKISITIKINIVSKEDSFGDPICPYFNFNIDMLNLSAGSQLSLFEIPHRLESASDPGTTTYVGFWNNDGNVWKSGSYRLWDVILYGEIPDTGSSWYVKNIAWEIKWGIQADAS